MIPPAEELNGLSREEIIKLYGTEPYNWTKVLNIEWVELVRGQPIVRNIRFNADNIPCTRGDDAQAQLTFLQFRPTGVLWTCAICGKTDGPISNEFGREMSKRNIEESEAFAIMEKTGQYIPVGLKKNPRGRNIRIRGDY